MPAPKGHPPYNVNDEGGRPIKYTDKFIEDMADKLTAWLQKDKGNIWFERFAYENDFDPNLFQIWAKNNKRFSGAFRQAKTRQKCLLVEGGLVKKFNWNMCQLLLGWEYGIHLKEKDTDNISLESLEKLGKVFDKIDEHRGKRSICSKAN
jgi:hypothetical protein